MSLLTRVINKLPQRQIEPLSGIASFTPARCLLLSISFYLGGGSILQPAATGGQMEDKKPKKLRPDQVGAHRVAYEKNKRKILLTQDTCAICGQPVDKTLKYPHPLSPTVDHIIPVARGGHPSSIDNLQLAHFTCNRQKWDKIIDAKPVEQHKDVISNRVLPQSMDWTAYKS